MKILILCNKMPFPPHDGGSIATLNMITGLSHAGNEVSVLAMNTRKHAFPVEELPTSLNESIRFFSVDMDTNLRTIPLVINFLFSRKPYLALRFHSRAYRSKLVELLKQERFDLIQMEGPYLGHYLPDILSSQSAPVSLRAHNVEHVIWKRKAGTERNLVKKLYFRSLSRRIKRFESGVLQQVTLLVAISPLDEAILIREGFNGPSIVMPAGLDLSRYRPTPLPDPLDLFFIGALDWMPNQEGLKWFIREVLDRLQVKNPGILLHVAGRNAPAFMIRALEHPGIRYHGEVEDASTFINQHGIMIAPLFTGSGIRIKILEGMALGRPVVTTSTGMEGIPAARGTEILTGNDRATFLYHILSLLDQPDQARRMGQNARKLVQEKFDTFGLSSRLTQFFKKQV